MVVDTGVVAAALLGEESSGIEAEQLLAQPLEFLAPAHWKAEFANVVWKAVIDGRVPTAAIDDLLSLADGLPIASRDVSTLWRGAVARAVSLRHPVYDTLFVELAARVDTFVASFDRKLQRRFPERVRRPRELLSKMR